MESALNERIVQYRAAMTLAKEMLEKGIISPEEYTKIDTIMTKKYGVSSSTIYR